jgi:hypothetical protein
VKESPLQNCAEPVVASDVKKFVAWRTLRNTVGLIFLAGVCESRRRARSFSIL